MPVDLWSLNPFARRKARQQEIRVFTGDRRVVSDSLEVMYAYLVDHPRRRAYFLPEKALVAKAGTASTVLPIDERSAIPLYLGNGASRRAEAKRFRQKRKAIAKEHLDATLGAVRDRERRDRNMSMVTMCLLLITIVTVIMIMAGLFMSGNLHLPWGG